jgi:hypothetical protein
MAHVSKLFIGASRALLSYPTTGVRRARARGPPSHGIAARECSARRRGRQDPQRCRNDPRDRDEPIASWSRANAFCYHRLPRRTVCFMKWDRWGRRSTAAAQLVGARRGPHAVISTTSRPLLPLVQAGSFIETLLYRLNTICLDVDRVRDTSPLLPSAPH